MKHVRLWEDLPTFPQLESLCLEFACSPCVLVSTGHFSFFSQFKMYHSFIGDSKSSFRLDCVYPSVVSQSVYEKKNISDL